MADPNEEVLGFRFDLQPADAIKAANLFQKTISKQLKLVEKNEKNVNNQIGKLISKLSGVKKAWGPLLHQQVKLQDKLTKAISDSNATLSEANTTYESLGDASDEAKAKQLANIEKIKDSLRDLNDQKEGLEEKRMQIVSEMAFDPKAVAESLKDAGEIIADPFVAILAKDLPGVFRSGGKLLGTGIVRAALANKHVAAGAVAASQGKGLKELSGFAGKLGGLINMLGKLGPIMELAGGFTMGLVKILIDAEAAAKDYNKQILATASTSDILGRNMGNVDKASKELESSLNDLRDGGMAWSNVQWGISKETAVAFQSALLAEGVTMHKLGEETKVATGYAKDQAKVVQMGVAYSRAFGVSLNDIAQLQGEWTTELGMGLDSVQAGFQTVVQGADEAGMASGKFFGIIRSFSADLSLFTLRLEDVTKVMMSLGKSMSPRNAQKFLQTLTQQFSGGDILGNLQTTVVAGTKKTAKGAKSDFEAKLTGLLTDLKGRVGEGATGELKEAIDARDLKAVAKWQVQQGGKVDGAIMEQVTDAVYGLTKVDSGNAVNVASVLDMLSPMAKANELQNKSLGIIHKRIEDANANDILALNQQGINTDMIRNFVKFEQGTRVKQEELFKSIRDAATAGPEKLGKLQAKLQGQLGVKLDGSSEDTIKTLEKMFKTDEGRDKFWNTLTKDQQHQLDDSSKQIDYAKETSSFQTSAVDRLGIIADILMNQIYKVMTSIWGAILDVWNSLPKMFGGQSDAAKKAKIEQQTSGGGDVGAGYAAAAKELEQLTAAYAKATDEEKKTIEARMKILAPLAAKKGTKTEDLYKTKTTETGTYGLTGGAGVTQTKELDVAASTKAIAEAQKQLAAAGFGGANASSTARLAATAPGSDRKTTEPLEEAVEHQEATADATEAIHKDMTTGKGFKLNKTQLSGPISNAFEDSTYNAVSKALFEYYMYSSITDRAQVANAIKLNGMDPKEFAKSMTSGETPTAIMGAALTKLPPAPAPAPTTATGAAGGAAPAAVDVHLHLHDDLKKVIKNEVSDHITNHAKKAQPVAQ